MRIGMGLSRFDLGPLFWSPPGRIAMVIRKFDTPTRAFSSADQPAAIRTKLHRRAGLPTGALALAGGGSSFIGGRAKSTARIDRAHAAQSGLFHHLGVDRCRKTALFRQLAGGTGDFSGQSRISWSAPHLVDTGQAARLTIRRACSCSNLAGLRYPSAEWSRLLL